VAGPGALGPLLDAPPGAATTDVHSIADGNPSSEGVIPQGLPEPRVKRTVEGDLGMRHNAATIVETEGAEAIAAAAGLPSARVAPLLAAIARDVERLPQTREEIDFDQALVRAAVRQAVIRHCGTVSTVYTTTGPATVQHGKDLSGIGTVIGTGGALVHSPAPHAVLAECLASGTLPQSLRPRRPRLLLDREYLLYACGLLGSVEPQAALELALAHLEPLPNEGHHERTRSA
jgi:uncharacterized protein (TIGR01319 family)